MLNDLITGWNSISFNIGGFTTHIPDPLDPEGGWDWGWGGINIETPNLDMINLLGGGSGAQHDVGIPNSGYRWRRVTSNDSRISTEQSSRSSYST